MRALAGAEGELLTGSTESGRSTSLDWAVSRLRETFGRAVRESWRRDPWETGWF